MRWVAQSRKNPDRWREFYYSNPIEASAHGVQLAAELQGRPDWRNLLRKGAKQTQVGKKYAAISPNSRKRMFKNAYSYASRIYPSV